MGLFDFLEEAANKIGDGIMPIAKEIGSAEPNDFYTEEFRCVDCGLVRYYPNTVQAIYKTFNVNSDSDYLCTKGDGTSHDMKRV